MNVLITGMNGTVAPVIAQQLQAAGHELTVWDRQRTPPEDESAARAFILESHPDWFLHVATGSLDWAQMAAQTCAENDIRFLFTSSVSVFDGNQGAPLTVNTEPRATDDYGRYKLEGERRVLAAHPAALVVRLGWQIGTTTTGNHMLAHLHRTATEHGMIEASTRWIPSCAYLEDSADALHGLMRDAASGVYQLEGNPGLSFHEIVTRLNQWHGFGWNVQATQTPEMDNRMSDPRVKMRFIDTHW
jgi:dTDP-4-dehydrorhamnose reductase